VLSKEVAISTFAFVLKALSANTDPTLLKIPLDGLTDILERLDDNELYSDWYPSATHAEEIVKVSDTEASSCANGHSGEDALSVETYWLSKKQTTTNRWSACIPISRELSSVTFSFEAKFEPKTVTLLVREKKDSEWIEELTRTIEDADSAEDDSSIILSLKKPRHVESFQLKFTDFNRSNTNQQHTLSNVVVKCTHKLNKAIMPVHEVLNMLQNMAVNVIRNTNSDESLRNAALRSLCALVRTTGSVSHLLNLLRALLSVSTTHTLNDVAQKSARRLTKALLERYYDNAAFLLAEEDTLAVGDTSSSSNSPSTNDSTNAMQTLLFESGVKISLESSGGQVLSVTKNGLVIAPRTRNLGPNEMLTLEECDDGWAFQTSHNKLLGLGNSNEILDEKKDEDEVEDHSSHVIATKDSPATSKETWSVVREGQYILLRGQNEHYVTIGSVGGVISCDAVNRAQATKFRVLLRMLE